MAFSCFPFLSCLSRKRFCFTTSDFGEIMILISREAKRGQSKNKVKWLNIVRSGEMCQYKERFISRDYAGTRKKVIGHYRTVGAVMIPMKRIRHQLRGWEAWNTKICFRKNVFNSVSCWRAEKQDKSEWKPKEPQRYILWSATVCLSPSECIECLSIKQ